MTDLAAAVERDLDALLAEAPQDWLDGEPQVREEHAYLEWDTYQHQAYAVSSKFAEVLLEMMRAEVFPPPANNTVEWMRKHGYWGEGPDGSTS